VTGGECTYCFESDHDKYDPSCEGNLVCPDQSSDLIRNIPVAFVDVLSAKCVSDSGDRR